MQRVLVIFASKHGATQDIAAAISRELRACGLIARTVDAHDVDDIEADAIVLGSAVYMGRWRREAKQVLHRHAAEFSEMPFWVFSSGPVGDPADQDEGDERWLEPTGVVELIERLGVRDHVVFGGSIASHEGPMQRMMARNVPEEFQDRRDFGEIRAWARTIAGELGGRVPVEQEERHEPDSDESAPRAPFAG
jgi:menaquinone-dependent protoporphyrinogen oxidase